MKKFLVICLSVVMLFSTMLLTGFASYQDLEKDLKPISTDGGYVGTVYFDTTKTVEEMNTYFMSLPFSFGMPIIPFVISQNGYTLSVIALGENQFILFFDHFQNFLTNGPTEENTIFSSSIGWLKSSIDINSFLTKSVLYNLEGNSIQFTVYNSSYFAKTDYPKEGFSIVRYPFIVPTQSGMINIFFNRYLTVSETVDILDGLMPSGTNELILYQSSLAHLTVYRDLNDYFIVFGHKNMGLYYIFSSSIKTINVPNNTFNFTEIGWLRKNIEFLFDIDDYIINPALNSSLFSSYPIEYVKNEGFVKLFLNILKSVFVDYPLILASGVVLMFTNLFFYQGALTILGNIFIILIAMSLVTSIFYIVFNIFKGKIKKRL